MRGYISNPTHLVEIGILLLSIFPRVIDAAEPAAEKKSSPPSLVEHRIQPSDVLDVTVYREPDLCLKVRVSQTGNISYPLLGSVAVAGLTAAEAQEKLTGLFAKDYLVNPRVTVSIETSSTQRVVIIGQVKSPGSYEIPMNESLSVLQLIARAGGFTDVAATDRIMLLRGEGKNQKKITVNVAAIIKGSDKSKDIPLEPGDIVSVPETLF